MTKRNWLGVAIIAAIFLALFCSVVSSHGMVGVMLFAQLVGLVSVVMGIALTLIWCFKDDA